MTERPAVRTELTPRFEAALVYASQVHAGQKRKGTEIPYIAHLLSVAGIVLEEDGDEDEAIAALLHDAVEDQGGQARLEDIGSRFGDRVAEIVEGCTDADTIPKPEWQERKERHLAHLRGASSSVLEVSAADKLHNARAILAGYRIHGESALEAVQPRQRLHSLVLPLARRHLPREGPFSRGGGT